MSLSFYHSFIILYNIYMYSWRDREIERKIGRDRIGSKYRIGVIN